MPQADAALLTGFAPILPPTPRVLVLGSMPSEASLSAGQYYAHPRNAFWPIMRVLLQLDASTTYADCVAALQRHGVALWDVVHQCRRVGSLDSAIDMSSVVLNDIGGLLQQHASIRAIFCNGGAASDLFQRHFGKQLPQLGRDIQVLRMPSTSPANARLSLQLKCEYWRVLLDWCA